ncbi:EamA family transporter [Sphingobium sp. SCG-1]|nr:EamA family transporter [Sphingobium sp. SCG-1]
MLCLATMFALVKLADTRGVHLAESLFYRQAIALPIVFGWICMIQGPRAVYTKRIGTHASRAVLGSIGMVLNFGSYILLPLAEATTIGFSMPIFATILSALLLKEATGFHRWSAVLLGFVGVLIMVRPDANHFPLFGVAVALGAAVLTACISLILRELGRTEGASVTVFWFTLISLPPLTVGLIFKAQAHDSMTWLTLIGIGISGGIAQLCMTGALRWGPVSLVLPMDYSSILWATLFGWFIWNEWPLPTTWIGAAFIVASGLYIAWREHVRLRRNRLMIVQ